MLIDNGKDLFCSCLLKCNFVEVILFYCGRKWFIFIDKMLSVYKIKFGLCLVLYGILFRRV